MESIHTSVLLNETIEGLNLQDGSVVIDGTFGGGGHSREMCEKFKNVKIIAIDQDKAAWEKAQNKFEGKFQETNCKISFHNSNFRDIDAILKDEDIEEVDGVILDLGLSSDQLENSERGFSFMKDEPLIMTMKKDPSPEDLTAGEIVNTWSEESLADIIYGYGEERFARRIAKAIVEARKGKDQTKHIETTFDLVRIISDSVPAAYKRGRLHFATRTFQALRIATNDELTTLSVGLTKGFDALKKGGRIAVISFHSLEDRIIKRFYKEREKEGKALLVNKKPILAHREELIKNNRARSAKLRILQKV